MFLSKNNKLINNIKYYHHDVGAYRIRPKSRDVGVCDTPLHNINLFIPNTYTQGFAQYPETLDSLKIFLKTQKQDTIYILALNEFAFLTIQEGKFTEAEKSIKQIEDLSTKYEQLILNT